MSSHYVVGLTILVAVGAGCVTDAIPGPVGLEHAVITPACGPADGPAVTIYLASTPVDPRNPPMPHIRIAVWEAPALVGGRTWALGGASDTASAILITDDNQYEVATGGFVSVGVIDTAATTNGITQLVFPTIGSISGKFRATWSYQAPLCG